MNIRRITHHDLKQFTGDLDRYHNWLNGRVLYTAEVKFLADRAVPCWLIETIATHFGTWEMAEAMQRAGRLKEFQF